MAGIVYCFNTICDHRIYKAGHTQQTLQSRLRGYLGPSRPRVIVASRKVDDSVAAETMILGLLQQCSTLAQRTDLGNEWFELKDGVDVEECHKAILFVFDVVSKAVRAPDCCKHPDVPTLHPPSQVTTSNIDVCNLPGMEGYFDALERFVCTTSKCDGTMDDILQAFEDSDFCPVFSEYVMWPRKTRLSVACNRFPHISYER